MVFDALDKRRKEKVPEILTPLIIPLSDISLLPVGANFLRTVSYKSLRGLCY